MPWPVRALPEITQRLRGSFREWLPGTDTGLANNFVTVTLKVVAALAHEFELRMGWLTRQMFLTSATGAWLEQHCSDIGIYRKLAAAAVGRAVGTGEPDATYAAGIRFVSGGQSYVSTEPVTASLDGDLSVPVAAETRGAVTNREAGAILTLGDPALWAGLGAGWTVDADGLGGGADKEDDESLRSRGLHRKQYPPRGGALTDYERIARAVPGVVQAWAYRRPESPGFIVVLFLFAGREDLIPIAADVEAVQAAIDVERLIRVDDGVAAAPVVRSIPLSINGLSRDTPEIRAAIEAGVTAMFLSRCRPGIAGNTFTISKSWIGEVISGVTGEERHVLSVPPGDIVLTGGQWPVLGPVTYGA